MTDLHAASSDRKKTETLSKTALLLLCLSFSLMSFYLLPSTPFANWSLLAPFARFLRPENVSLYSAFILVVLTIAVMMLFRSETKSKAYHSAHLLYWLTVIYIALLAATAIQIAFNKFESDNNNCAIILQAMLVGFLSARLCGSATKTLFLLTLLCLFQALFAIYDYRIGVNILWSGNVARAGGTFNHPFPLYTLMICLLPFALIQTIRARSTWFLALGCCSFALLMGALVLTWMRGGMFAAVVSLTFVIHAAFKNWKLSIVFFVFAGSLCFGVSSWRSHDSVDAASTNRSNFGRIQLWKQGILIFKEHPLSGIGLGATELPVKVYSTEHPKELTPDLVFEPKNLLLHWADELGIGGLIFFGLFVYAIIKSLRGCKDNVSIALGGAWIAIFIAGLTDTPFGLADRACGNILIGLLLGATMLYALQASEQPTPKLRSVEEKE